MAQGEFWVERQNWARWPRVLKVNRVTDSGTETRRYVRKGADWEAKDYATRKIAELQAENAKLRELVARMAYCMQQDRDCDGCATNGADGVVTAPSGCDWLRDRKRELGVVE